MKLGMTCCAATAGIAAIGLFWWVLSVPAELDANALHAGVDCVAGEDPIVPVPDEGETHKETSEIHYAASDSHSVDSTVHKAVSVIYDPPEHRQDTRMEREK